MDKNEIDVVRELMGFLNIYWDNGTGLVPVKNIPEEKRDPDNTGISDYIAIIDGGHIDLSNTDKNDFYRVARIFATPQDTETDDGKSS